MATINYGDYKLEWDIYREKLYTFISRRILTKSLTARLDSDMESLEQMKREEKAFKCRIWCLWEDGITAKDFSMVSLLLSLSTRGKRDGLRNVIPGSPGGCIFHGRIVEREKIASLSASFLPSFLRRASARGPLCMRRQIVRDVRGVSVIICGRQCCIAATISLILQSAAIPVTRGK